MNCNKCFLTNPSDRMRLLRTVLKIKKDTFCKYMGIAPSTLYFWEYKTIRLTNKQKERLRYVGINPQWIDYGTGEPLLLNQDVVIKNIINFKQ